MRVDLVIIDPQNDFCDIPGATLPVPGASADLVRLAAFIAATGHKFEDIHVTLDSHHPMDIAHPSWWMRAYDDLENGVVVKAGSHPDPFTMITEADVTGSKPKWVGRSPFFTRKSIDYVKALAVGGRYPLVIWPEHCLIGTWGTQIFEPVSLALRAWERKTCMTVDYVTKGSNPFTEHYSAVKAEVSDPDDPTTSLNAQLIKTLSECDIVVLAGEALSHCVANTVRDIAAEFGDANIRKLVLLEDCCSNVTGFEHFGKDFIRDMTAKGMKLEKSTTFLQLSATIKQAATV